MKLVGTDADHIVREAERLLDDHAEYARMARIHNPYGDGRAASRIRQAVEAYFGDANVPAVPGTEPIAAPVHRAA